MDNYKRFFEENGYLLPGRIYRPSEARQVQEEFIRLSDLHHGDPRSSAGHDSDFKDLFLRDQHLKEEFIWRLASNPIVLDLVEVLLGPDILLFSTHFFCKNSRSNAFVGWHQDAPYWGFDPPNALTVWYAVDDSNIQSGCLRVIPGTHKLGPIAHGVAEDQGNMLSENQHIKLTSAQLSIQRPIILKAGEISIHHGLLVHGSLPNASLIRRAGLTMRYVSARVKQISSLKRHPPFVAICMRGRNAHGNFREADPPVFGAISDSAVS